MRLFLITLICLFASKLFAQIKTETIPLSDEELSNEAIGILVGSLGVNEVGDEALAECENRNLTLAQFKDCLPETQVALVMLNYAGSTILEQGAAIPVVKRCKELNDNSYSALLCLQVAVEDANKILDMVGSTERIKDPITRAIANPNLLEGMESFYKVQKRKFPRHFEMCCFSSYKPYEQ